MLDLNHPAADEMKTAVHRIEIERTGWTSRRAVYRVHHDGRVLIEKCRDPEHDSCRALLALGKTGKWESYFPDGTVARMRGDIAVSALLTCQETDRAGLQIVKHSPFVAFDRE